MTNRTSDYMIGELVFVAGRGRNGKPVVVEVMIVGFFTGGRRPDGNDCVTRSNRGDMGFDSRRLFKDPHDAAVAAMKGKH